MGGSAVISCIPLLVSLAASPIVNPAGIDKFLSKLESTRSDSTSVVRVVQIGDSHLQAGFFGGRLRERFQEAFGNAGRGMVFPHRIAGTNGASDLRWQSSSAWAASCALKRHAAFPWGVGGWSLQSLDSTASLDLHFAADAESLGNKFRKVRVLGSFSTAVVSGEEGTWPSENCGPGCLVAASSLSTDRLSLRLSGFPGRLDGLVLESGRGGVLWDEAGTNGLSWADLLRPSRLWEQLPLLSPDLVVVSLGTNDAWSRAFDEDSFRRSVQEVLRRIRLVVPKAEILLTLPPDHARTLRRRRTAPDLNLAPACQVLREACDSGTATCVDLLELMGGEGSWKVWSSQGAMARDHVHYSKGGYVRQADLIAEALLALPRKPLATDSASSVLSAQANDFLASQRQEMDSTTWEVPEKVKPPSLKKRKPVLRKKPARQRRKHPGKARKRR
jgi:lysophospholipase L1-like esterase